MVSVLGHQSGNASIQSGRKTERFFFPFAVLSSMIGSFKQDEPALAGALSMSKAPGSRSGFVGMFSGVFAFNGRLNAVKSASVDLTPKPPEFPEPKTFNSEASATGVKEPESAVWISGSSDSFKMGLPSVRNTMPSRKRLMVSDGDSMSETRSRRQYFIAGSVPLFQQLIITVNLSVFC